MTAPILAVTGLKAEARIANDTGIMPVAGGGDSARLAQLLADVPDVGAVISFGIAGGLAPGLPAGTVVVASGVGDENTRWPADPLWRGALLAAVPEAVCGDLAGVDRPVAALAEKARLHERAGALAVDMESHVAARFAHRRQRPFAAFRVIADPAERALPRAALVGMTPEGDTDVVAVLKALARRPAELAGLIRTAFDARTAFASLRRIRLLAGPDFGFGRSGQVQPVHGSGAAHDPVWQRAKTSPI